MDLVHHELDHALGENLRSAESRALDTRHHLDRAHTVAHPFSGNLQIRRRVDIDGDDARVQSGRAIGIAGHERLGHSLEEGSRRGGSRGFNPHVGTVFRAEQSVFVIFPVGALEEVVQQIAVSVDALFVPRIRAPVLKLRRQRPVDSIGSIMRMVRSATDTSRGQTFCAEAGWSNHCTTARAADSPK